MKKIFALILSILYLTSSVGATVNLHYCMEKLIGWDLSESKGKSCDNCGMPEKQQKDCCKHEQKQVKLELDQKAPQSVDYTVSAPVLASSLFASPDDLVLVNTVAFSHPQSHAPPGDPLTPVYLRNRVFLI